MFSLGIELVKKTKRVYHQIMHTYHSILYKDCLNEQMKQRFFQKIKHHEERMAATK